MQDDYRILLNFLPVEGPLPSFRVYRRLRLGSEPRPDESTSSYSFGSTNNQDIRDSYWVKTEPAGGFDEYTAHSTENNDLTRSVLAFAIRDAVRRSTKWNGQVGEDRSFLNEISLILRRHAEGTEQLVLQPYLLRETHQFGCLADFRFRKNVQTPFSRKVQQLSLSLNRQYKRNLDCYIDRVAKIRSFLNEIADVLADLALPGTIAKFKLNTDFVSLPGRRLRSKIYIFANNRDAKSQFSGLRDYGPLHALEADPHLLFVFREQDRVPARTLAAALRGSQGKERFSFPGFKSLFKADLNFDPSPVILPDLTDGAMANALREVQVRRALIPNTLPILVLPEGDDNGYLAHKADFSHAGIPTQVCTLRVIQDESALKWAIANIALQIFCKSGGQPWKVRPTAEPTLIVGISQSHKLRVVGDTRSVEKYFAFTVLTDNSGLFQKIQVLGEGGDKAAYLHQLQESLRSILSSGAQQFSRVVVHTSFKLKRDETNAIQETVTNATLSQGGEKCRFAVVKVNHKCRFFGINQKINSLVPFEGTAVKLGSREYLVWFEGILPDKPTVTKAYPGPTHLQFMRVNDGPTINDEDLLQDILNLSGANWRGFNAKSAPVSVFYCHLVADRVHDFHERGLPLPEVPLMKPWFL
jgi:Piwi domain